MFTTLSNVMLEILTRAIRQEKGTRHTKSKGRDQIILGRRIENPKDSTKMLSEFIIEDTVL